MAQPFIIERTYTINPDSDENLLESAGTCLSNLLVDAKGRHEFDITTSSTEKSVTTTLKLVNNLEVDNTLDPVEIELTFELLDAEYARVLYTSFYPTKVEKRLTQDMAALNGFFAKLDTYICTDHSPFLGTPLDDPHKKSVWIAVNADNTITPLKQNRNGKLYADYSKKDKDSKK